MLEKNKIVKYLTSKKYKIIEEDIPFENDNQVCYYKFPFIVVLNDDNVMVKDVDNNRKYVFDDYKQYKLIIEFIQYNEHLLVH
jgi:hypothetical protein